MRIIVLTGAFVILWFLVLQILLPIGIKSSLDGNALECGADPGAPENPRLGMKLVLATLAAAAMWMIFYAFVLLRVIDI